MRNILAALLVGLIIVVTQPGSVIVIGVSPDHNSNVPVPMAVLQVPALSAHHALVQSGLRGANVRLERLPLVKIGTRRGPVK
jgi:hypothetical protein